MYSLLICFFPLKPNQEDQDHFFGRIAENFVVLFLPVPIEAKDTFFQVNEHLRSIFNDIYRDTIFGLIKLLICHINKFTCNQFGSIWYKIELEIHACK